MLGDDELSPKELSDGEEKTFREGKVQFSTSPSCLKEMWVGSAGEAWRLMLQKGALTAFPLVVVLLGGPIGLGCHFCYLILCMWTRLIQRAGGWRVGLSAGQQQKRKQECHSPNFEQITFGFCASECNRNKIQICCWHVITVLESFNQLIKSPSRFYKIKSNGFHWFVVFKYDILYTKDGCPITK